MAKDLEAIAYEKIGPTIGKALLGFMFPDCSSVTTLGSGLLDALGGILSGTGERRRVSRELQEIGDAAVGALLPIFEVGSVPENDKAAVILALAETLEALSVAGLVRRNMDPQVIYVALRDEYFDRLTKDFTVASSSLYSRALSRAVEIVVEIASEWPSFDKATAVEVLLRTDDIRQTSRKAIEHVERLLEIVDPSNEFETFEQVYRSEVARRYNWLELFGVEVEGSSKRYPLSTAYVSLCAEGSEEQGAVSIQEMLGPKRLLLFGEPGSGKTTLLSWLAVQCASRSFDGKASEWNSLTPFLIKLRRFKTPSQLPSPEDFVGWTAPNRAGMVPAKFVHDVLDRGAGIILIDGVDEVPGERREAVKKWVRELVASFPKCRYVVTGRPVVSFDWLEAEDFKSASLLPMEFSDIDAFIDHWHNSVGENPRTSESTSQLAELATSLKAAVRRRGEIRQLVQSPLLCAMVCALHRDRNRELPEDRVQLYNAACDMLVHRRDREREVEFSSQIQLTVRQKRKLLGKLAYWMIRNGYSEISFSEAEDQISKTLLIFPQFAPGEDRAAGNILRLLVERSGLLREPEAERLDFTHKTFQEFLAAKEATDAEDIGLLVMSAHLDEWREVVVLAVGQAQTNTAERILTGLLDRADNEPSVQDWLYLLAVAARDAALELSASLSSRILEALRTLVPPKTLSQARELSKAGELVVPLLKRTKALRVKEASACVRTLGLIVSDASLEVLRTYQNDSRVGVQQELNRAATQFGPDRFYERVSPISSTKKLSLRGVATLKYFSELEKLTYVTLKDCPHVCDLDALARSSASIVRLTLSHTGISTFKGVERMSNLKSLDVSDNRVYSFSNLAELENLHFTLQLPVAPKGPGLDSLRNLRGLDLRTHSTELTSAALKLKQLSSLSLQLRRRPTRLVVSSGVLADFRNLKFLGLRGIDVESLKFLRSLGALECLQLSFPQHTVDLAHLGDSSVSLLELRANSFINIEHLLHMTNLSLVRLLGKIHEEEKTIKSVIDQLRERKVHVVKWPAWRRVPEFFQLSLETSESEEISPWSAPGL